MHLFGSKKQEKKLLDKKDIQICNSTLQKMISFMDILIACHDPTTIYDKLWYYQKANQENLKEQFRFKVQQVYGQMNKKQSIINTIKQINKKQKLINQSVQELLKPKQMQIKLDNKTEAILKNIGKIKRKDQKKNFEQWQIDPLIKNLVIDFNRTKVKYNFVMNSIISYKKKQNTHFIYYMGDWMDDFEGEQKQNIMEFDNELNRGWGMKIKEAFVSQKPQQLIQMIQDTLNLMENAKDFTELNNIIFKNKQQAYNYKIFQKITQNSKTRIKLQTVLRSFRLILRQDTEAAQGMLAQVDSDIDFDALTKATLKQVTCKLFDMRKCESLFMNYGIKFQYKSLLSFIEYFQQIKELVKSTLEELQTYHSKQPTFKQDKLFYLPNDNENIFYLMPYLKKLIEYITSPSNTYRNYDNGMAKQLQQQQQKIQRVPMKQMIEEKNGLIQQLQKELKAEKYKNNLLNNRICKLNSQIKKVKGEQELVDLSEQQQIQQIQQYEQLQRQKQEQQDRHCRQIEQLKAKIQKQQEIIDKYEENLKKDGDKEKQTQSSFTRKEEQKREQQMRQKKEDEWNIKVDQLNCEISQLSKKLQIIIQEQQQQYRQIERKFILLEQYIRNNLTQIFRNNLTQIEENNKIQIENLQKYCQQKQNKSVQLSKQMDQINLKFGQINSQVLKSIDQKEVLQKQIIQKKKQLQSVTQLKQKQNVQFGLKISDAQKKINELKYQNQVLSNKVQDLLQQKNKIDDLNVKIRNLSLISYFSGQIFIDQLMDLQPLKQLLIANIESHSGLKIKKTRLVYKPDNLNPTQPHAYIDKLQNWVALFKLPNNYIIGAFSPLPYETRGITKSGFMFNLNTNKFYKLLAKNQKAKIYQYEQFYFIIGNSQIRYRFSEKAVENQFGSIYKYFDTAKDTSAMFFGSEESKIQVKQFEFYQLIFDQ